MVMAERMWQNLLAGIHAPALDYRKPLLIYWFMSHVIKYVLSLVKQGFTLTMSQGIGSVESRPDAHDRTRGFQDVCQARGVLDDVLAESR